MTTLAQYVQRSDSWAKGGKPGITSTRFTDSGKPFQEGWSSIGELDPNTHGTNKNSQEDNYKIVYPFNVKEVKGVGKSWHKYLESQYTFLVVNKKREALRRGLKELGGGGGGLPVEVSPWYKQKPSASSVHPGIPELQDIRGIAAVNYSLLYDCNEKKVGENPYSIYELRQNYLPLGIPHTTDDTASRYPKGAHVMNFTIAGEIDCYNIWDTEDCQVEETDILYLILKPVPISQVQNMHFCFDMEGSETVSAPIDNLKGDHPHARFVWQIRPWVSKTGDEPPFDQYEFEDKGRTYRGTYWSVGMVKEIVLAESLRKPVDMIDALNKRSKKVDCLTSVRSMALRPIIRVLVSPIVLPGI